MEISTSDLLACAAIAITIIGAIIGYCIHVELKFKKLENEINYFEPIKEILQQKGQEHVISVFKERKR
jgi:uncharacterized membrane protein YqgA involved in biofilm formation